LWDWADEWCTTALLKGNIDFVKYLIKNNIVPKDLTVGSVRDDGFFLELGMKRRLKSHSFILDVWTTYNSASPARICRSMMRYVLGLVQSGNIEAFSTYA